jgi:hypothetical protein
MDQPVVLDDPINSEADDFAFMLYRAALKDILHQTVISTMMISSDSPPRSFAGLSAIRSGNNYCYEFIEENALKMIVSMSDSGGRELQTEQSRRRNS